jgi:apolipoprotein N-acyltransferase
MRAIEAQRPLLRAANDGVSALVGEHGQVLAQAGEFQPLVLRGTVQPRSGLPPYVRTGNLPVIGLSLMLAALAIWRRRPQTAVAAPSSTFNL